MSQVEPGQREQVATQSRLRPAEVSLLSLPVGVRARLVALEIPGSLGRRLQELGLTPGAPLVVERRLPLAGPLLVRVREYALSMRRAEAAGITVQQESPT